MKYNLQTQPSDCSVIITSWLRSRVCGKESKADGGSSPNDNYATS